MNVTGARTRISLWILIFLACLSAVLPATTVHAAQITTRSLTLQEGSGGDGGSAPGGTVNHLFSFTIPSNTAIGSIRFEYCTTTAGACTAPTGFTTAGATLGAQTGMTGWNATLDGTATSPFIDRGSAAAPGAPIAVTYRLDGVTNPTNPNETFYVRITTYQGTDGATNPVDAGVVAASTAEPIDLEGQMPESLTFCTGATVPTTGGSPDIPDCDNATAGDIDFNQLFSPESTATATSQMAASTNAGSGYVITVQGATLTSGSNTIPAMTVLDTSNINEGQFGMNLVDNATPDVGADIFSPPTLTGATFNGQVEGDYATADQFKFLAGTPQIVASSNGDVSDIETYTVTYIVNVLGSQPAGTYTTTLTYVCTATY